MTTCPSNTGSQAGTCAHRPRVVLAAIAALVMGLVAPSAGRAEDVGIINYGMHGFFAGAEIGLAAGYLSTGSDYESEEWRNLAFGGIVGALGGAGVGILLGITDAATDPPPTGYYVVRGAQYGALLGALVGMGIGALFLLDDSGETKDLVTGASIGALSGAGAGIVFGIVEGASGSGGSESAALRLHLLPHPDSLVPAAMLSGSF